MTDPTHREPNDYAQESVDRGTDQIGLQVYPIPDDRDAPAVVVRPAVLCDLLHLPGTLTH